MSLPPTGSRKVNVYLPELQLLSESEFTTGTPLPAWDYVSVAGQPLAQIGPRLSTTELITTNS